MKTFFLLLALSAHGTEFTVTSLNDSGAGSLREAISAANATPAPDTIRFSPELTGSILLASTLSVTRPLEIIGHEKKQIIIDGQNSVRVINLTGSTSTNPHRLENLIFQNGTTTLGGANVRATGSISLINCDIIGGRATAINGSNNNAQNADGGGIHHSAGQLLIENCLISNNMTIGGFSQGGGIYTQSGTAEIRNSRIINNTTDGLVSEGGGIGSRSITTIENCEIAFNETLASSSGGGGIYSSNSITMRQCTISNNTVGATPGTGIAGYSVGGGFANVGGLTTFEHCTLTENSAPHGMGQGAGISSLSSRPLSFFNCIIANNGIDQAGQNPSQDIDETPNRQITYQDLGFNIFGTVTNTNLNTLSNRHPSSEYGIENPQLSSLDFHGGSTRTHIPLPNSLALDRGSIPAPAPFLYDQRGTDFPRISGAIIDIGATERQIFSDADSDLIPDSVEAVVPGLNISSGDLDNDGVNDFVEYNILGIEAISNPAIRPKLTIDFGSTSGTWTLIFPSSPNREYRLLTNTDLGGDRVPVAEDYSTFPDSGTLSANSIDPVRFYFLDARVPSEPIN